MPSLSEGRLYVSTRHSDEYIRVRGWERDGDCMYASRIVADAEHRIMPLIFSTIFYIPGKEMKYKISWKGFRMNPTNILWLQSAKQ